MEPKLHYIGDERTIEGCFYCETKDSSLNHACGKCVVKVIDGWHEKFNEAFDRIKVLERALELVCPLFHFENNTKDINYEQVNYFTQQAEAELAKEKEE